MGEYVDLYKQGNLGSEAWQILGFIAVGILILTFIQSGLSTYVADKIGLDLRNNVISKLKDRSFVYMRQTTSGHLITVLTSDIDAVKNMIANGLPSILMAGSTILGAIIFLLIINFKLGLITILVVPFIVLVFVIVFRKLSPLFEDIQKNLDSVNKTINESIIASPLVRVLDSKSTEVGKFDIVNKKGTDLGKIMVSYFAILIPSITLLSQFAVLVVLWFGGKDVVSGTLSLGEMSAFFAYTSVLIWPFFILSFAGTLISRANVSLKRIDEVLHPKDNTILKGHISNNVSSKMPILQGHIVFRNVTLSYGGKDILKDISFIIKPQTRTAIIGPTGAGKTELFYLIAGLAQPTSGEIIIDGIPLQEWNQSELLSKLGMVFQDSIIFNTTIRENILFKSNADASVLDTAILVSDLSNLIEGLPNGLDTNVSERGVSLSGGQKQRLMLARALAINPSVLLLDDFTARVDAGTEDRIHDNIKKKFGDITLISITQKIEPIKNYDHIILLMEGELIGQGKHEALLTSSMEYRQILETQKTAH